MENSTTTIEKLFEKAENYSKTTLELCKYKAVNKSVSVFSNLAVKMALAIVVGSCLLFVNIGLAFWIGQELESSYCGFFVVAFFYMCLAILLYIFREEWVKTPVSDYIISEMRNENLL